MARPVHKELALAAERLAANGHQDSAAVVRAVAAPGGWTLLRSRRGDDTEKRASSNLTLTMSTELKEAIVDAADDFSVVLSAIAADGFRAVIAGEWRPAKTPRTRGGTKTVLNVTIDEELSQQVQELLDGGLSQEAGYRITRSSIAIGYIAEELGVDRPAGSGSMNLVVVRELRDHLVASAEAEGVSLQEVLEDGIGQVLTAGWLPPKPVRAARGTGDEDVVRSKLTIPVNEDLREQLHDIAPRLSEELGYKLFPGTIARSILTARFGEPPQSK